MAQFLSCTFLSCDLDFPVASYLILHYNLEGGAKYCLMVAFLNTSMKDLMAE